MDKVITVSREFGSGGRELGVRLAEHFGIPFYDKELISMAADHADMAETAFQHYDEKLPDMHDPLDRHYYNPFSAVYRCLCLIRFLWRSPVLSAALRSRAPA